jgi:hypothetical protein
MIRGLSLLSAAGLVILWAVGLNHHATAWFTWLNGFGAMAGFLIAAGPGVGPGHPVHPSRLVALGLGLSILSIIGFLRHAPPWLASGTLVFASAFLSIGIAGGVSAHSLGPTNPRPT